MRTLLNWSWSVFFLAFSTLFVAEMGDKTQLAVFSLVTDTKAPLPVFLGAGAALLAVTLIGVLFGGTISKLIPAYYLKIAAGILFMAIGAYTLWGAIFGK
jgi:putative Ca2+/H+ antiporter (TMEM165/GDT1 family)